MLFGFEQIGFAILPLVQPVNVFTVFVWIVLKVIDTSDWDCGYDWPWDFAYSINFSRGYTYHNFHQSKILGNYGGMMHIIDALSGTKDGYIQSEKAGHLL